MHICAYRGYATRTHVCVRGRVLANRLPGARRDEDRSWHNLRNTYRRLRTEKVIGALVTVRLGESEGTARTDREGYYRLELPRLASAAGEWLHAEAICEVRGERLSATHDIVSPGAAAEFGVISDLDDTVIETNITSLLTAAKLTFMGNAKTRKPLEGVAALYTSLQNGHAARPVNPIFYVSTSPWNLYDLLCEFMELNAIPAGPLFLRDWGLDTLRRASGDRHKRASALQIMNAYPTLPFVLVGDSGQHDAGLYAEIAALHPDRIRAIYIRDVDPMTATRRDDEVRSHIRTAAHHGVPMLLAADSEAMAQHAARLGLIPAREQTKVAIEVAKDQDRPTAAAAAVTEALGIDGP